VSHKNRGNINILFSTAQEFKIFRNTECNPTQEIVPWGMILSKNEGHSNWNKMVKPSVPTQFQGLLGKQQLGQVQGQIHGCS